MVGTHTRGAVDDHGGHSPANTYYHSPGSQSLQRWTLARQGRQNVNLPCHARHMVVAGKKMSDMVGRLKDGWC